VPTLRLAVTADLHWGHLAGAESTRLLVADLVADPPDVLILAGDLGTGVFFGECLALFDALDCVKGLVPGNHDLPYTFPARFTRPWAEFERQWETTEPTQSSEALHVVGLNSARPYRHQGGALREDQLLGAAERLQAAPEGAYRVAVLHHHMLGAPWRASRKRPVSHRNRVLRALVTAGADLILAGHIHQGAVSERHEFEVIEGDVRAAVVSIAPGLGQPRPNRLGEARGLHVYEPGERTVVVHTYIWRGDDWGLTAHRTFPRGLGALAVEPG